MTETKSYAVICCRPKIMTGRASIMVSSHVECRSQSRNMGGGQVHGILRRRQRETNGWRRPWTRLKRRGQSVRLDRHDEVQRKRQRRGGYFGLSLQPVIAVILYCVGGSRVLGNWPTSVWCKTAHEWPRSTVHLETTRYAGG